MSRVGRRPIAIPSGVAVKLEGASIRVEGPKGTLAGDIPGRVTVSVSDGAVSVSKKEQTKESKAEQGLTRSVIQNMVEGVSRGYTRTLEVNGVGYRAEVKGDELELLLGFSHPVRMAIPKEIQIEVGKKNNIISVSGCDKRLVGAVAAQIRSYRPPEPYKGKGIKYVGEHIVRKLGKRTVGTTQ